MNRAERRRQQKLAKGEVGAGYLDRQRFAKVEELLQLGLDSFQAGNTDKAINLISKALELQPDNGYALGHLGGIYHSIGQLDLAIAHYKKSLSKMADHANVYNSLGKALKDQGKYVEAQKNFVKALELDPKFVWAHYNLGNLLKEQGKLDDAVLSYEAALAIKPDLPQAHTNLGNVRKDQGRFTEAVAAFNRAIVSNPGHSKAHFSLSRVKKYSDIADIEHLRSELEQAKSENDQMFLGFALAKALADIDKGDESFEYYLAANRLHRKTYSYSIVDDEKIFARFIETFDAQFFAKREGFGTEEKTPIFIVGMPRSGSTLVEQILASHPEVHGAGELPFLQNLLLQKRPADSVGLIPDKISRLKFKQVAKLGDEYIAKIRKLSPDSPFITDKMPHNFLYVGIIKLLLPNAKIIHSVRSPEDTCFSIFRQKFYLAHPYAYNLTELGRYYRLYSNMMCHWHTLFPGGIHDIHYEHLTANQELESQNLLKFCGLQWNEQCLNFYKNDRVVSTASNFQVRQPIYQNSVGGWRQSTKQLQPLLRALSRV